MIDRMKCTAVVACVCGFSGVASAQDHLFGVNRGADIVRYDLTTGECSIISDNFIGPVDMWSMAKDSSGRIFAGSPSRIYQVFPNRIVEYANLQLQKLFAMAFAPGSDTIIYAMNTRPAREFYRIDISIPGAAQKTLINARMSEVLNGLVFSPSGTLYGWSNNIGLVIVDPLTGGLIDVNPAVAAPDALQSLAFDSSGMMWGAGDALFTIDLATGITTAVGNALCVDVTGIEFSDGLCYADCDVSTGLNTFDIFDFLCFQTAFVGQVPFACDCDVSTGLGVCDIFDFLCFQASFVGKCP
jgi:hypothetical protein